METIDVNSQIISKQKLNFHTLFPNGIEGGFQLEFQENILTFRPRQPKNAEVTYRFEHISKKLSQNFVYLLMLMVDTGMMTPDSLLSIEYELVNQNLDKQISALDEFSFFILHVGTDRQDFLIGLTLFASSSGGLTELFLTEVLHTDTIHTSSLLELDPDMFKRIITTVNKTREFLWNAAIRDTEKSLNLKALREIFTENGFHITRKIEKFLYQEADTARGFKSDGAVRSLRDPLTFFGDDHDFYLQVDTIHKKYKSRIYKTKYRVFQTNCGYPIFLGSRPKCPHFVGSNSHIKYTISEK